MAIVAAEAVDVVLDAGVKILSLFWGESAPFVSRPPAGDRAQHGSRAAVEAREAVAVGVDIVVFKGWEAGGHVRGTVSTLALVPRVVDEVDPVPVIAAGGSPTGAEGGRGARTRRRSGVDRHPLRRRGIWRSPGVQQLLTDAAETDRSLPPC